MNGPRAVSTSAADQTDTTVETYNVSNGEFLLQVFGTASGDARPVVVSFSGDPTKVPAKSWFGRPWRAGVDRSAGTPPDTNSYFSVSVFKPDVAGEYRRKKANFAALHAVMLDDVGTKVDAERLTLPPSWLIETSPGNHQAGYLLREPLADGNAADRLMNAVIAADLCDPGANGPRARLARLPVGTNGKHKPPFSCKLIEWRPDLRYSIDELVGGLQLDMTPAGKPKPQNARPVQERPLDGDPVWMPRPDENAVLAAIRSRGLYKGPLGDGKHDITCPWVQEHTGAADGGTAYFEPDDSWPIGGFKCLHGHCAHRRVRDLLQVLGIEPSNAIMKPMIRVVAGEMDRVLDASERELAQSGRFFQRGGLISTVVTDPDTRGTRVQEISLPALVRALSVVVTWERFDGRSEEWIRIDPPARHAGVLFDSTSYRHLPVLKGLTRQPYLRPDGSLMTTPGYDLATCMFGVFDAREFLVPTSPSRQQAEEALELLKGLLAEFSFADSADSAGALVAMLTAVIRPSLPHAPMFHLRAHTIGSGKSYLCELITAFATPQRSEPNNFPGDDVECHKLLLALLVRSPAVIEFDNLTGDLMAHKSLCTALTSEHISGRLLGFSKVATPGTRALFLSSGNNVGPVKDMSRRCITINLSPLCEDPAERKFERPELVQDVLRERGCYVSAALTIVRAWIVAGRPMTECKSLGGFGEWSALCRQPLLWLGLADATKSVFTAMAEDPDRETLGRLLAAWRAAFGKRAAMVRDVVKVASGAQEVHAELRELLHDIAEEQGFINRRKLGWWIKRHSGRIVDGLRFVRASGTRSADAWHVESVSTVLSDRVTPILESVVSIESDGSEDYARASNGE